MTRDAGVQPKILLFSGPESKTASLLSLLDQHAEVQVVDSFEQAVQAIQSGGVDVVVGQSSDFLPGQCDHCTRWVRKALGTTREGMVSVGLDGEVLWSNTTLQEMPSGVLAKAVEACMIAAESWKNQTPSATPDNQVVSQVSIADESGESILFEVSASPLLNTDGHLTQVAAVVRDVTQAQRFKTRLQAVEQAGRQLARFDAEQHSNLSVPQRVEKIESLIASYAHSLLNFQRFSIRLLNRKSGNLPVAMAQGMSECVFHRELTANVEGQGICGFVAATGRSYICLDAKRDRRYLPGMDNAGSSLTVPLMLHDEVIGVFNVESDQPAAFDDTDRRLLEVFGRHVAMALKILDLLVVERYRTTGQLVDDVASEIAAPLNDILCDASSLMSEFINEPALISRLEAITQNVDRIRKTLKDIVRPINGLGKANMDRIVPDPLLTNKRILVADDEDAIRQTIDEVLRKQGCTVDTARDGAEAINLLGSASYDLVLADIRMPHKNGYEVFTAAKQYHPSCQVIFITGFGYDPNHSIVRARKGGLAAVLFKPFKVDQLLTEVRKAVGLPPQVARAEQAIST